MNPFDDPLHPLAYHDSAYSQAQAQAQNLANQQSMAAFNSPQANNQLLGYNGYQSARVPLYCNHRWIYSDGTERKEAWCL